MHHQTDLYRKLQQDIFDSSEVLLWKQTTDGGQTVG